MDNPRVVYRPRPGTTPEQEKAALAAVYRFVLDCHAKRKGGADDTADDAKEMKDDRARVSLRE